ncbi:hypothetical protein CSOJ01_15195 [Colletotrichum sojae]|uniref:ATP-citrate synthase/succinyl-CoA ligase C-terminal domain-containing protein n=1 Tax=Colletotrichum sojae TaxID=2175907 RepID=A0A8H6MJ83_9PEZI|nr:hypothetical protein CSOJ01_15195 [Colletotrichum sojae]
MPGAGDVGCVVNGAGLAMATNDAVALHGGSSANFLDGGGQATRETMVKAFEIVLRDERVRVMLVNIYGGITRGDMIAEATVGAAEELGPLKVPMVVRLQGTNSELGLKMVSPDTFCFFTDLRLTFCITCLKTQTWDCTQRPTLAGRRRRPSSWRGLHEPCCTQLGPSSGLS